MGTEVLRPQDCLTERLRLGPAVLPRRKPFAGNPSPCRKPVTRPEPRKRYPNPEPAYSRKSGASSDDSKSPKNLVMGQVTILKRGESLDSKRKNESLKRNVSAPSADLIDCCVEWLGPDPEMVPKQLRIAAGRCNVYAGSAFYQSPSPSSLPLPTFSRKKDGLLPMTVDDSATKDLRRLLRLN